MAEITAALVKELREKSGAGMMDCKKALTETGGDIEAGMDWLRTKGLSKAAKKADRIAAEGLIAIALRTDGAGMTGVAVEVNAETDFVARNEKFQAAARAVAKTALDFEGGVDQLADAKTESGETVNEMLTTLIATIGENMTARRMARFMVPEGGCRRLRPQRRGARPRPHRRAGGAAVHGRPRQADRDGPQDRHAHRRHLAPVAVGGTTSTPRRWSASAPSSPSRPRLPASRPRWSRRWSRAASASSTRRSCC